MVLNIIPGTLKFSINNICCYYYYYVFLILNTHHSCLHALSQLNIILIFQDINLKFYTFATLFLLALLLIYHISFQDHVLFSCRAYGRHRSSQSVIQRPCGCLRPYQWIREVKTIFIRTPTIICLFASYSVHEVFQKHMAQDIKRD